MVQSCCSSSDACRVSADGPSRTCLRWYQVVLLGYSNWKVSKLYWDNVPTKVLRGQSQNNIRSNHFFKMCDAKSFVTIPPYSITSERNCATFVLTVTITGFYRTNTTPVYYRKPISITENREFGIGIVNNLFMALYQVPTGPAGLTR